ncbi:MAG: DUF2914 domain-containing protein, partial [Nevskia sp.]|nr:DUF2914 domain-containing protein [Nevskia sp.]
MQQPGNAASPRLDARLQALLRGLERYRLVLAVGSFALGAASFALVQRNERLAQWIALLLVLNWLLIVSENTLGQWLSGFRWARFSPLALRYAMQAVHQETFFFCLPFVLSTTTWSSGQALFTALACAAALATMWDPLYYGLIAPRPALHLALHGFAMYLAMLTVPPLLWQLTTTRSLALASATIGLLSLPSLAQLIGRRGVRGWLLLAAAGAGLGLLSWLARPCVPPATLRLSQGVTSATVDADLRQPGAPLEIVSADALRRDGICAFTAIRAPRGLREQIYHRWLHRGQEMARVTLPISGGRKEGYRAWSCLKTFPQDADGRWAVQVVTDAGQMIGVM